MLPFKQYNAFAGSVALAIIMLPVIMRTTEEILKLIPGTLREASLALGVLRWRTTLSVVVRTGLPGHPHRASCWPSPGPPARPRPCCSPPSAAGSSTSATSAKPMDALPLFIYMNARQPYELQNQQAWGAAFLLLLLVLSINVFVRLRRRPRRAGAMKGVRPR